MMKREISVIRNFCRSSVIQRDDCDCNFLDNTPNAIKLAAPRNFAGKVVIDCRWDI
jgi:hypothetical protein